MIDLELNDEQLERNDIIDNTVFECIETLAEKELDWDMQLIGETTDAIKEVMTDFGIRVRHPGISERDDGTQYIDEYADSSVLVVCIKI
jgi:hypothetical protein